MLYLLLLAAVACHGLPTKRNVPTSAERFLIIGDFGSTSRSAAGRVADAMNTWAGQNGCDFILSLGDNFYQDGPPSVSHSLFNERWADVYTGSNIRDQFWFMSVGNHDYYPYEGYEWNEVLRTTAPGEERWYLPWLWYNQTLDTPAGTLDLIVADSQAARKNMNDRSVMYQWLEDTLKWSYDSNHLKIVVSHHPARSAGNYYPGSGTIQVNFEPRTVMYEADFFLHGHDHNMQHISYKNSSGPEIMIIGGGGAGLYSQDSSAQSGLDREGLNIAYFAESHGFAGVIIDSNGINIDMYDDNGSFLHRASRPSRANRVKKI